MGGIRHTVQAASSDRSAMGRDVHPAIGGCRCGRVTSRQACCGDRRNRHGLGSATEGTFRTAPGARGRSDARGSSGLPKHLGERGDRRMGACQHVASDPGRWTGAGAHVAWHVGRPAGSSPYVATRAWRPMEAGAQVASQDERRESMREQVAERRERRMGAGGRPRAGSGAEWRLAAGRGVGRAREGRPGGRDTGERVSRGLDSGPRWRSGATGQRRGWLAHRCVLFSGRQETAGCASYLACRPSVGEVWSSGVREKKDRGGRRCDRVA